MTNLPINISSVPVKATASKQSGNIDAAQQEAQDFGNVLSQKVADSAKPAELSHGSSGSPGSPGSHGSSGSPASPVSPRSSSSPRSSGDNTQQVAEEENADSTQIEDAGSALPADMLAVLLGQQNQPATPQPDTNTQPGINAQSVINIQPTPNTPISTDTPITSGKDASASLSLIGASGSSSNSGTPALDTAVPQINNAIQESKGYTETFKTLGMKETSSTASNQPLRSNVASDLTVSAQQPAILPLIPGAATSSSSPSTINTPLNQPAWGDEFSQKITWMATQRNQSAELHLNPPQLGPLDVVLKMNGDQATAMFTSPHAAVREAIEQALPKLREMLADSGIMLGNAMVSDQTAKNDQNNSSHKPQGRMPTSSSDDTTEGTSIQEVRVSSQSRHNGMVDTFA